MQWGAWIFIIIIIAKHQALNKCPYELATDLELGKNKWLDLIHIYQRITKFIKNLP